MKDIAIVRTIEIYYFFFFFQLHQNTVRLLIINLLVFLSLSGTGYCYRIIINNRRKKKKLN